MKKQQTRAAPQPLNDFRPLARREGLIIEEIDNECLVYDTATDKAHCLNRSAATIWRHCDGARTVGELETLLDAQLSRIDTPEVIAHCLAQLEGAHLLVNSPPTLNPARTMSRRELLRKLGIGLATAAVVVPIVSTITAPTAHAAASCRPDGSPCETNSECCSHSCEPTGESFVCRGRD